MTPAAKAEWRKLKALAKQPPDIRKLFAQNPERARQWALEGGGVFLDSSKSPACDATLAALHNLARAAQAKEKLQAQMRGEKVNFTEKRPAMHSALRAAPSTAPSDSSSPDSTADFRPARAALRELERAIQFAQDIRNKKTFAKILHIGIGGSHLGPELLRDSLARQTEAENESGPEIRFVANADPASLADAMRGISPDETLVVAVSKSFSTGETLENARAAKAWLENKLGAEAAKQRLAAVTANPSAAREFGVPEKRVFKMDDWVGGRYSLWSAASLSAVAAVGEAAFREFLRGGGEMDAHALSAPPEKNIPMRMALLGIWHCNFLGAQTHCVVAYQSRLRGFARYLQQLVMESNGKRALRSGGLSRVDTGEVVWGGEGTNDQHSYFQLMAQGTRMIPADFILAQHPEDDGDAEAHRRLLTHALGWSRALMSGRSFDSALAEAEARGENPRAAKKLAAHQECPGNRPSNTVLIPKLSARTLGALTALYEHKVALQSFIWGTNAFDQWGVESGKKLTREIAEAMSGRGGLAKLDPSTRMLLEKIQPA